MTFTKKAAPPSLADELFVPPPAREVAPYPVSSGRSRPPGVPGIFPAFPRIIEKILFFLLIVVTTICPAQSQEGTGLAVEISSSTAILTFVVPEKGCVIISAEQPGKNESVRIWGPQLVSPGAYRLRFPARKIEGKKGTVEWFKNEFALSAAVGRGGRGERQFINPSGIGWDNGSKELYVADTGNDRIIRLTKEGKFISQYGGFGIAFGDESEEREDSLDEPWDVVAGGFSNLYVSDQNNDRICEFDAYKNFQGGFFPKKEDRKNRLSRPKGISRDFENNLWIVDSRADRVLKISPGGTLVFELGGFGRGTWKFKEPTQVAVDNSGQIFVCDRGNHRIQVFDRLGSHILEIKDHLKSPMGVAVSLDGLVYVCDESTGEVGEYLPNGKRIQVLNGTGKSDHFRSPTDLEITGTELFVADSGNHRIVIFHQNKRTRKWYWKSPAHVLE